MRKNLADLGIEKYSESEFD
jgi:proline dehydrogenase